MCYSALVRQNIHELARHYGAEIAYEMFAELFRRSLPHELVRRAGFRKLEQRIDPEGLFTVTLAERAG